jgi:hypothetical protein
MSVLESLSQFWIDIVSCTALGAILGWVCRGRVLPALVLSIPVSIAWVMLGAWYAGTFSNQFSWQDPYGTIYWIGGPYLVCCFLPATAAALLVTIYWRCRTKKVT